jgi:iron complex outermembrane recepter protein
MTQPFTPTDMFEMAATGDLMDIWAGTVRMAAGYQWRDLTNLTYAVPLDAAGHDYNTAVGAPTPRDQRFTSEVKAVFVELEVPVLDTVDLQLAVRHERFSDFGFEATTPKIAARWEITPELAVRGSWGESFLAPTPEQARTFIPNENCLETFSGTDPFTNRPMTGSTRCESGNPNLKPEQSEIQNIGITWQPTGMLDGFEFSMDYQEIEYTNRIRTLTEQDTVAFEFQNFLADTGISESGYDPTAGSATRAQAQAWYADRSQLPGNSVVRFGNFELDRIFRQAANISSVWIDLIDAKVDYRFSTDNLGTFDASWSVTSYQTYEYEDLFGGRKEALGFQNANTGIVPPLPDLKYNFRVNWFMGDHSASVSTNYWSEVTYDDRVYDNYGDGWTAPEGNIIHGESRTNLRYTYALSDFWGSDLIASAGINNVFGERPQQLPILGGFESRLSTPWGRQFWLSLEWTPNM